MGPLTLLEQDGKIGALFTSSCGEAESSFCPHGFPSAFREYSLCKSVPFGGCCALIHFKYPVKESRFYNTAVRDFKCQGARSDCMYGSAFCLWPEDGSLWDDGSGQGFTL